MLLSLLKVKHKIMYEIVKSGWLLITLVALIFSSYYIGYLFRRKTFSASVYEFSLDFFVGQVIFSLFSILISLVLGWKVRLIILIILIFITAVKGVNILYIDSRDFKFNITSFQKFLLTLLTLFMAIYLLKSFVRPYTYDDVVYHLPVVKEISEGLVSFPLLKDNPMLDFYKPFSVFYGSLPYASEGFASILYTISFSNLNSVHLIYFANFVLFILFVYQSLKADLYIRDKETRLVTVILVFTLLDVALNISTGYVDLNIAIYQFVSLILVVRSIFSKKVGVFYVSLLLFGYTLGIKYTAAYALPVYSICSLIFLTKVSKDKILKTIAYSIFIALIGGGFWYVKNTLLYGNPVFPLYFGHKGLDGESYKFILETQADLGADANYKNFINFIKITFADQWLLFLTSALTFVGFVYKKTRIVFFVLLSCGITVFMIDFFFGSQISRFSIILPVVVVFLSSVLLDKYKILGNVSLLLIFITIAFNPMQHSIWGAIVSDSFNLTTGNIDFIEKSKVGCGYDIKKYLDTVQGSEDDGAITINFWDPYISSFYEDENLFYNFEGKNDIAGFIIPENVKYVFVNEQMKNVFLSTQNFHRDIDPLGLHALERKILGDPVYRSGNCVLYRV